MVLLALLTAGAYSVFTLIGQGPTSTGMNTQSVQALNFARDTLERLRLSVSSSGVTGAALANDPASVTPTVYPDDLPSGYLKNSCGGTRQYEVKAVDKNGDGIADYTKVTVTVRWNG